MKPDDFFAQMQAGAQACQSQFGIPASFTLAQAALESFWGTRAPGNNLFGIKADKSWKGQVVDFATHEHLQGKDVELTDGFRAYASPADSLADHAAFLKSNPRYAACFREKTGEGWARAVAAAGYATDPAYAAKLISIIRGHNLIRFDQPEGEKK